MRTSTRFLMLGILSYALPGSVLFAQNDSPLFLDVRITNVDRTGSAARVQVDAPGRYTVEWSDGGSGHFRKHLLGPYTVTVKTEDGQMARCTVNGVMREKGKRPKVCRNPVATYYTLPTGRKVLVSENDHWMRRNLQVGDPPYLHAQPESPRVTRTGRPVDTSGRAEKRNQRRSTEPALTTRKAR